MTDNELTTQLESEIKSAKGKPLALKLEIEGLDDPLSFSFPQDLAQLSRKQFEALACFYFMPEGLKDVFKLTFLASLIPVDEKTFSELDAESIKDLLILAEPFLKKKPNSRLSFYKEFEMRGKKLIGPDHSCSHFIFDEYITAEIYFTQYMTQPSNKWLDKLCALLLRDKSPAYQKQLESQGLSIYLEKEDDHVRAFNDLWKKKNTLSRFLSADSSLHLKFGLLLNYMAIRNYWSTDRFLFLFSGNASASSNPYHWNELIVDLAGEKFGSPSKVRKENAIDVLTYINGQSKRKMKSKK